MKRVDKLAIMLLTLFIFAMPAPHSYAGDDGQIKEKGMPMPEGVDMHDLEIDGYKATFHIMNMPVYHKLMKSMGMKHSQMEGGTSHHVMVKILDNKEKMLSAAVVKIRVVDPRGNSREKALKPMKGNLGQYGADFKMIHRGKYRITAEFKASGKMHRGSYTYEMK